MRNGTIGWKKFQISVGRWSTPCRDLDWLIVCVDQSEEKLLLTLWILLKKLLLVVLPFLMVLCYEDSLIALSDDLFCIYGVFGNIWYFATWRIEIDAFSALIQQCWRCSSFSTLINAMFGSGVYWFIDCHICSLVCLSFGHFVVTYNIGPDYTFLLYFLNS